MASSACFNISQPIPVFALLLLLLLTSTITPLHSSPTQTHPTNQTFHPQQELNKLKMIRARLDNINKPALHTIQVTTPFQLYLLCFCTSSVSTINKTGFFLMQSPDGDLIDCVLSHLQPAFDHPKLKGQIPLVIKSQFTLVAPKFKGNLSLSSCLDLQDPPERPEGHKPPRTVTERFQLWSMNGENCPEGTVPIRRTTEEDMLRATSFQMFGRKVRRWVRRETSSDGHEVRFPTKVTEYMRIALA